MGTSPLSEFFQASCSVQIEFARSDVVTDWPGPKFQIESDHPALFPALLKNPTTPEALRPSDFLALLPG